MALFLFKCMMPIFALFCFFGLRFGMDYSFLCTLVYKECVKIRSLADGVFSWLSLCVTATLLTEPLFHFVSSICKEKMHSWDKLLFKRHIAAFPKNE